MHKALGRPRGEERGRTYCVACAQLIDAVESESLLLRLCQVEQEAQLMLTNPCDAFRGHSRSPNIVPFHRVGILSFCAIVTLSLRRARFSDI